MKKTIFSLCLILLVSIGFSQNLTEVAARKILGERFISSKEAGFTGKIKIPFQKENVQDDKLSWLLPIQGRDGPKYILVQARYSILKGEQQNVLSTEEAEEVAKTIKKTHRSFPDNKDIKFFGTNDHVIENGLIYQKIIAFKSGDYQLVNAPLNTSIILLGEKSISYIIQDETTTEIVLDLEEEHIKDTKGYPILTLISKY